MGQVLNYSRRTRLFCVREGGDFESKGGEMGQVKSVILERFKNTDIWGMESNLSK